MKRKIDILLHDLVPIHLILTKSETEDLLRRYRIHISQLPRILETDAAIRAIGAKRGDVVHIIRKSRKTTVDTVDMFRFVVKDRR
ncbi:MAG TPA: DNA-directed RNA polymerase subunit H [Candidatus Lokiarchaeia archaeon]|nr:DNA-directed RNA polymerase subunit H [Candidatus Lokiarchaeia archaeon]